MPHRDSPITQGPTTTPFVPHPRARPSVQILGAREQDHGSKCPIVSSEELPHLEMGFAYTMDQREQRPRERKGCNICPPGGIRICSNPDKDTEQEPRDQLELQSKETKLSGSSSSSTQQQTGPPPGSTLQLKVPQILCKPVAVGPLPHPGMTFTPPMNQRVDRHDTDRVKGGCCICPSGGIWVCYAGPTDDEQVERAQRVLQRREAEACRPQVPPQPLPLPQPSVAGPSREPWQSMPPEPCRYPPKRQPAKTLPPQVRPDLPQFPRQAAGGRTQSLRARPTAPSLHWQAHDSCLYGRP